MITLFRCNNIFTFRCSPLADIRSDIFSDFAFELFLAFVEVVVPSPATTVSVIMAACEL